MEVMTSSHLRANLAETLDRVNDDCLEIIITRTTGKPAILMSLDDYNSWKEMAHLMASPANKKHLLASIAEVEQGLVEQHDLIKVDGELDGGK